MDPIICIKVRNPEWYWSQKEIKESASDNTMSYAEWKLINENKIEKHVPAVTFDFDQNIENIHYPKPEKYEIEVFCDDDDSKHLVTITDVTVAEFIGKKGKSIVVVSNEILHNFWKNRNVKGSLYWYFYIKENSQYFYFSNATLLSIRNVMEIHDKVGKFYIKEDSHFQIRESTQSIPVPFNSELFD